MIKLNAVFQLLCVGVVMGKSVGLLDLISNFIGVAIVLQVDELLASYLKIKDIEPKLLSDSSWKTKMLLSSKLAIVVFFGILVYLVTLAVWYSDEWYIRLYYFILFIIILIYIMILGLVGITQELIQRSYLHF